VSLLSSNPERIQLKSCAICINKGRAEIRQKTAINKKQKKFWQIIHTKKVKWIFQKVK
jgi:hypothetical protein